MKHGIRLYQTDPVTEFNPAVLPIGLGFSGMLAGLFMIGVVSAWPLVVVISAIWTVVNMILWMTNERWGMGESEVRVWNAYRELDEDTQKRIPLTPQYIRSLPAGDQWDKLRDEVLHLKRVRDNRIAAEAKISGQGREVLDAIREAEALEKERLLDAQHMVEVLREKELL